MCVDKGDWDKPVTSEELDAFNLRWLTAVREHMKDNATIWISGTHHNIFSVQQQLLNPNRSLEKASCHFLMTAIRKTALYILDP